MKLNPKQAPLYGECVLTVQLSEEECVEDEEDVEFYLLFSGSTQRHLTTTLRLGHVTLQAVCPAHDRDETVRVTLCQARPGGSVDPVAEERFQFVQDLALDMAQFLISAASHRDGLEGALLLDDSHIPVQECERLDETLTLALKHLPLPPGWSVLGSDINTHTPTDSSPHETLLHFAARRGLRRVALFLLQQPGGHDALRLNNKHGDTPARVAQSTGHTHLQHLLSELEKSPHLETKTPRRCHPAGRAFLHHPRLNTFTLTVEREADAEPPDLRRDVDELRRYVRAHGSNKGGPRKQWQSFPLILSRDFVDDLQTVAVTPSDNPTLQKPPVCELQEVGGEKGSSELSKCPNGSARSEVGEAPASSEDSDSGKGTLRVEGEGVCAEKQEDCAAVSAASCGEQQQQEEVDSESRVIGEAPRTHRSHAVSETKSFNIIQSGNKEEGTMGQNQGLLPENNENKARGDLPEEREGERNSSKQETFLLSRSTQPLDAQTNGEKRSRFYRTLDFNATEKGKEIQEAGNVNDPTPESTGWTKGDQDVSRGLDSLSFRPNMAPGPVHNVRLEPSQVLTTTADQADPPPETVSEQVSLDSVKEPPSCDVTDAPGQSDRLVLDEGAEEIQVDQTLVSETEQNFLKASENDLQPIISSEIPEETSQTITVAHCGGQEPSQEHSEPQSDAIDSDIMDTMDQNQNPVRSQSPITGLVLNQILTDPQGFMVFDSFLEQSGLETKAEREPLSFQTPPESPCEFFSIDGLIIPCISVESPCSASLELGRPAGSRETMEGAEKVETDQLEMCDGSKKSPVTILCGSFSKLTIEGSPNDPQLHRLPLDTTEGTAISALAGDSESSTAHPSEMQETKEEDMKLELKLLENSESLEPSQIVSEENLKETALTAHDVGSNASNDKDVQEACIMMPAKLGETPEISLPPCNTSFQSPSVSENITDPHSVESDTTSEDQKSELNTSTKTVVETSPGSHLEVSTFEENIPQKLDPETFEKSNSGTSLEPLPEVKIPEQNIQDQQVEAVILNECVSETSLALIHDSSSFVETSGDASLPPLPEVNSLKESIQQTEKSTNDPHDPKHEGMTSEKSIRGTLNLHQDLTIRDESFDTLPEVSSSEENVLHQTLEALEESVRETSLDLNHDLPMLFEETIEITSLGTCSEEMSLEENVLDQQLEGTTCERSENETSQDHKPETGIQDLQHKETTLDHQPVDTTLEESIRGTSDHNQFEETTCEKSLGICLEPEDARLPEAPVCSEAGILDAHVSVNDSGLALENISTSVSDQPMDLSSVMDQDSGTGLEMDASSPVETDSGLIQDLSSAGVCLNEEHSHTEKEHGEEPKEEQVAGDDGHTEAAITHLDQCSEIHREEEEEVLYSLDAADLKQECSKDSAETDVPLESVCRSVSATWLPGSESISDGDSLLGPDTTDDSAFKQNEDTLTLTSGISMTESVSTDDSSITHPVGETEEEEKKDRLTEVLERSAILRSTSRSHSPSRRHSWGPSKDHAGELDMGQRSVVEAEEGEKPAPGHRRSMSWCPSHVPHTEMDEMNSRSYSLEGLAAEDEVKMPSVQHSTHSVTEREERGSLASLTEEENESNAGDNSSLDSQKSIQDVGFVPSPHTLTKCVSMSAISPRDLDDGVVAASATGGVLENSISEEDPAPLRSDFEVKPTKVSRTFSYLKSKMSKKSKEKDRDKNKDGKEKEKKSSNNHLFLSPLTPPPSPCLQCNRPISTKEALTCTNCNVYVHKGCRDGLPVCAKVKMKQQSVTDGASPPGVLSRGKSATARERPWSSFLGPEDPVSLPVPPPRKNTTIMPFNSGSLSKSISISNIAGQADDAPLKSLRILSQSTDSLNKLGKVNESTESLTDEGAEVMDSHLMAEFEADVRELEADSWSFTVDKKYLKQQKKDVVKRQDVIYELIQTEMHHLRTLRIMADVYSKGLQKEVQVEVQTLEKMFPVLDELLELHTTFFTNLLERRKEAREEQRGSDGGFVIRRIGDVLLGQVTGSNAEKIKKVYGRFCSRHNEAVNIYKELHTRDKRFQAFIKKKMSSAVVRRLSIPECILLVTQRITKYPVLLQRLLQHTREPEEEQADVTEALRQMKEVLTGVDSKVNDYEKRQRLKEVYSRTDSKSIMRMKSGQMFAREDLIRGRKLIHDGPLQLKNAAGRLKDVQALLLSDVMVFLQEKDQKYVFASLDQRSTVISLQKLIVREVANEERGLFFITAGIEKPEMVEVHASSKDERNTWMQLIQNATTSIDKDDDEGIPSENEEDKRLQESKNKEMKEQLQKKDEQIVTLLEEKVRLFRELCDSANQDESSLRNRMMFRATSDVTKGEPIIKDALKEVETLQELVNSGVMGQQVCVGAEDSSVCAGSVSLPRRAETFGGFDCHQINISKNGDREEADDLRRTESDSVLKKGGTANLLLLHKRNSEQVLQSVTRLHDLLNTLQAVVVQQDTFIEEQRQALSSPSLRHPSISSASSVSSLSSCSSRPSSLMEQEKQRQEEKIREEERRRREEDDRRKREEEDEMRRREEDLALREGRLVAAEEEMQRRRETLQREQEDLSSRKEEYQRDLLRLLDDQRRLDRERQQLRTHTPQQHMEQDWVEPRPRSSSTASEDSLKFLSSTEASESMEVFSRADSKRKAKTLIPFSTGSGQKGGAAEQHGQIPTRLLQLTKPKDKKEKKKKKGKGGQQNQATEAVGAEASGSSVNKDVYFC
ncbi:A-kinase anchor protein 13 isoform 1-T1 [Clarias gariepinus]